MRNIIYIQAVTEVNIYYLDMLTLTYVYHSSFLLVTPVFSALFDFWRDPSEVSPALRPIETMIPKDRPLYIFVSHHHKDHFSPRIFSFPSEGFDVRYILSSDTARFARKYISPDSRYKGMKAPEGSVAVMREGDTYSDGELTVRAFGSTDIGNSWVLEFGGRRLFHAGDLNAWIWKDESSPEEVAEAIETYRKILDGIAAVAPSIDYCLFPVDSRIGSDYFTGAAMMVRAVDVRHFFPMHFELADDDGGRRRRALDASAFDRFANPERGDYIALLSPCASFAEHF